MLCNLITGLNIRRNLPFQPHKHIIYMVNFNPCGLECSIRFRDTSKGNINISHFDCLSFSGRCSTLVRFFTPDILYSLGNLLAEQIRFSAQHLTALNLDVN